MDYRTSEEGAGEMTNCFGHNASELTMDNQLGVSISHWTTKYGAGGGAGVTS